MHKRRVCNRDIKPANIMLQENKRAVIIDFNVSRDVPMEPEELKSPNDSYSPSGIQQSEEEIKDELDLSRKVSTPKASSVHSFIMMTKQAGTLGYCAPERLRDPCRYK